MREEETEAGCIGDCRREREKEEAEDRNGRAIGPARLMTRGIKQY